MYGVRTADNEAVTMIEVDGRAYSPTFLRGSTLALTDNLLPLDVVIGLMEQPGGLQLGIDIATAGYRVRPGTGYPQLYSTLLADRGAAGQRSTHLIVRLDINESVRGLMYRRSIGSAAAAATERIVKALEQQGCRARVLNAEEQDAMLEDLSMGLASAPPRPAVVDEVIEVEDVDTAAAGDSVDEHELLGVGPRRRRTAGAVPAPPSAAQRIRPKADVGWKTINAKPGYVTSYYFSPEDVTTDSFNQMWSLRSDHIVHVMMLRKAPGGPVKVSALVRTNDPRPPEQPPTLFLNTLPGSQYSAALRAAPTTQPALDLPARVLGAVDELQVPVGPTGILVGAALRDDKSACPPIQRDDLVMWPLTDAAATDPHRHGHLGFLCTPTADPGRRGGRTYRHLLPRAAALVFGVANQHRGGRSAPARRVRTYRDRQRPRYHRAAGRALLHGDHCGPQPNGRHGARYRV